VSDLDDAFATVCANERVDDYRDVEPLLTRVARAIIVDGWEPEPETLEPIARRRAGYLLDVLREWMPDVRAASWARKLDALLATLPSECDHVAFWHRDRSLTGHDDLARRWGLSRGLELGRLSQSLAVESLVRLRA
jgi:hypothetical protein